MNVLQEIKDCGINVADIKALRVTYWEYFIDEAIYAKDEKYSTISLTKMCQILSSMNYDNTSKCSDIEGIILMDDNSFYERRFVLGEWKWVRIYLPTIEQVINKLI